MVRDRVTAVRLQLVRIRFIGLEIVIVTVV